MLRINIAAIRQNYFIRLTRLIFFVAFAVFLVSAAFGQTKVVAKAADKEETVNVVDISKQSSEAILEARQIKDRLISQAELLKLKRKTDSLVERIDVQMKADKKTDLADEGMRKLETNLIFLHQQQSILHHKKTELNTILDNLVENRHILMSNQKYWKKVKTVIQKKRLGKTVENSANEVLSNLSKTIYTVNKLTNITVGIIRKISALELEIDTRTALLNKMQLKKQAEILSAKQASLFALNYHDKKNRDLSAPFQQFYKVDLRNLTTFLSDNMATVFVHVILIIVLIFFFFRLRRASISLEEGKSIAYKRRLKTLLSKPISTALIIGIFASVIIYSNRPLIFKDLLVLLLIPPITILLSSFITKRYHIYIYALAIVLAAMILYSYLPVAHLYSRFLLLFISVIELLSALLFVLQFRKEKEARKGIGRFVLALGFVAIVVIVSGFLGNVFGKVLLARYLLFSIAEIVFVFFLIAVTVVIINGLSITFITGRWAQKSNFIRKNKNKLIKQVPRFFNILALLILGHYMLSILGWDTSFYHSMDEWLWNEYKLGSITFSWGRLFVFFFIIWLSIFIARIVRDVLEDDILSKVHMDEGLPHTIAMMARYTLITIGVLLAFSALGLPMSDLAIMFSAFGVGIGFGLQNIFNNLVSGFILLFERPIKIGDTIEVGKLVGTVRSIGIRASNIRTFDGAEIIVPNGNLISNEVVNWTLSDRKRRIEIKVSVSYNSDPDKVKEVLLQLLNKHEDVAQDPQPSIFFIDMGNSALVFRLLFWTNQYGKWYSIRSNMMYEVFRTLKEAGIEIPYDQLDLHIRSTSDDEPHPNKVNKDIGLAP